MLQQNRAAGNGHHEPPRPRASTPASARARRKGSTRNARLAARARKEERHAKRTLDKWRGIARARGGHGVDITLIPRFVWEACWAVIADASGNALRAQLRETPNSAAKSALLRAAFGVTHDGFARYRFCSLRARRIAALGIALLLLAKKTRKRGAWGGGKVLGVPRRALCELLRDVNDPREAYTTLSGERRRPGTPHVTALFGTHRKGATVDSGEVGYWVALQESGFAHRVQLKGADLVKAAPCELAFGPYATNQYWLCASSIERCSGRFGDALQQRMALLVAMQGPPGELEAELRRMHLDRPPPD